MAATPPTTPCERNRIGEGRPLFCVPSRQAHRQGVPRVQAVCHQSHEREQSRAGRCWGLCRRRHLLNLNVPHSGGFEGGRREFPACLTGSGGVFSKAHRRARRCCTSAHNATMSASFAGSESCPSSGMLSMTALCAISTRLCQEGCIKWGVEQLLKKSTVTPGSLAVSHQRNAPPH